MHLVCAESAQAAGERFRLLSTTDPHERSGDSVLARSQLAARLADCTYRVNSTLSRRGHRLPL
jgi:hypothetical protein